MITTPVFKKVENKQDNTCLNKTVKGYVMLTSLKSKKVSVLLGALLVLTVLGLFVACTDKATDAYHLSDSNDLDCCSSEDLNHYDILVLRTTPEAYQFVKIVISAFEKVNARDDTHNMYAMILDFLQRFHNDTFTILEGGEKTRLPEQPRDKEVMASCCSSPGCSFYCRDPKSGVNLCPRKNLNGRCWMLVYHEDNYAN